MIDGIPLSITDLSGWAVVALVVIMLVTGRGGIALRREVDAEKTRADTWQTAWGAERARNDEVVGQVSELLENSRATVKVVDVLYERAMGGDSR